MEAALKSMYDIWAMQKKYNDARQSIGLHFLQFAVRAQASSILNKLPRDCRARLADTIRSDGPLAASLIGQETLLQLEALQKIVVELS